MMQRATRHHFSLPLLLAALGTLAMASPLAAESYPSGMIRIVNGNAAGTPPDIVSRVVANDLNESERWYVLVENKVGAIGTIGAAEVLKQPADGQNNFIDCLAVDRCAGSDAKPQFPVGLRFPADRQARQCLPRPGRASIGSSPIGCSRSAYRSVESTHCS